MTEETIRVWPRPGALVRDEHTRQPIAPGQEVLVSRAVLRAIAAGDLLQEDPGSAQGAPEAAPEKPRPDPMLIPPRRGEER